MAQRRCPAHPLFAVLRSAGADVDAKDNEDNTPLMLLSCKAGKFEMVAMLIDARSDISAKDQNGKTPLHCAKLLLAYAADVSRPLQRRLMSYGMK